MDLSNKCMTRWGYDYERAANAMQVDESSKHANKNQKYFCDCLFVPFLKLFKIAFAFAG